MSTIDERIVSMKFDNRQFQNGVSDSLNSINNLKNGLNFTGATKGLDGINNSIKRISFDGLSNGLETVRIKFSALQVTAVTALANITNSAISAGKNLIDSLTIDPVKDGFREYETQMNSIQTILANTSSKGTTLEQVKSALSELNTYSDKTIYNFTEMTRNIGTFTAAGVALDKSTSAIKGIANLAAVSGSNSEQASSAMYQLSQAMAAGTVKLQDWNSVVNAGMGGEVFQKSLMETARAHGIAIDEMVKKEGSFRETLQKGWLSTDILTETLSKFTGDLTAEQLKTMGYTDEQIAGIIKMGQTANDAATKVKTISQLIDTLKEAVGSGWAQTWQTLFGDFEEAKVLFTSVSNTLGGMIGASSDARNKMLSGWKELGGRTALIDAIKNAFDGVMGVVKALGGAFRDVFQATTSAQLFSFTEGLKNLTEKLKLSDSTLSNLRSTFKGAFAILDIGKTIILAIGNAVGIILGGVGDLSSSVLGITGSFGEWITALDNTIKKSNIFNTVLSTLAYGIKNGFSSVAYILNMIVESIGAVINAISEHVNFPGFEDLHSFLGLLGKRMSSIGDESNNMAITIGGAFVSIGKYIADSKVGSLFMSIWNVVKMVSNAVSVLVGKMADSVSTSIKNADFSSILDGIAAISIGGMLLAFRKFMNSLSNTFEKSKGVLNNVKGVLDDVRGSFEAYQQNLKAGVLIKLGLAISLLAASIVAISLIDSEKLVSSLAAIGTLFAQLLVAMKLYSMIGEFKGKVIKASIVMLTMSTSILILSGAMKNLSSLDWNGLAKGIIGIAALSGTLVVSAKVLSSGSGAMIKGSTGMVIFAAAIKVLASACSDLSKLDWNGLIKGLVGAGVLMTEISLFLNTAKFSSKSITTATGIVILASAIKILASACNDFGNLSWSSISKGLTGIGLLLTEMSIFSRSTANAKNVISTGIGLIAIAASMKILASAMSDFGNMSWESIAKGLLIMGGALTEISIAVHFIPKSLPVTAAGLVLVGAALNIISMAITKMGNMSWESIAKGLIVLGGSLTILSIALNSMKGTIAGSAALLVASGALAILAPTLALLGAMTWTSIIKGLTQLAAVIAIFGISAAVLTPILPSMIGLGGALVLLGISMVGIGAGLALVGVGLSGIATGFTLLAGVTTVGATAIVTALGIIIVGIAALIPAIMTKIGEGIIAFVKVFTDSIPVIVECITTIIKAIVDCIVANVPTIVNGVLQTLSSILNAVITWAPTILQQVADILLSILKVIADNIAQFVESGVNIIVGVVDGISNSLPKIIDAAFRVVVSFINGLADAIRNNSGAINNACLNLVESIVDSIGSFNGMLVDAGIYAVKGFLKGLVSLPGKIFSAGLELGKEALNGAKEAIDSHSPSKEFAKLGVFSGQGFIIGLDSYGSKVANASSKVGTGAVNAMSNAISGISDIVNSDIDSQPTIRPVLDLSDIQNGGKQLYSMMNQYDGYTMGGSLAIANSASRSMPYNKSIINDSTNKPSTVIPNQTMTQQNTFNITGNNPKDIANEVSRILQKQVERRDVIWE